MSARSLIDTNVLVYAHDDDEPDKQRLAQEVLFRLRGDGVLCTQVLSEFAATLLRKFAQPMNSATLTAQVRRLATLYPVLGTTPDVVFEALRGVEVHSLSYYDAQIWAVARLNHIPRIITEDFTDGREIEGVRFVDPFTPSVQDHTFGRHA